MTIEEFIEARLDEDEAIAKAAGGDRWAYDNETRPGRILYTPQAANGEVYRPDSTREVSYGSGRIDHDYAYVTCDHEGLLPSVDAEEAEHIARHDPARVLREVKAHRGIVSQYRLLQPFDLPKSMLAAFELNVRVIARIYADHPDFREEWAA